MAFLNQKFSVLFQKQKSLFWAFESPLGLKRAEIHISKFHLRNKAPL